MLAQRPELIVEIEPRVVKVDGSGMKGRVVRLMAQGWFAEPRTSSDVRKEVQRLGGSDPGGGPPGMLLSTLAKDGFFIRVGEGYVLAPGIKVTERELTAV